MATPNDKFDAAAARLIVTRKDMPFTEARFDELFNYVIDTIRERARGKFIDLTKPFEHYSGTAPTFEEQDYIYDYLSTMGYKTDKVLDGNSDFNFYQIWW